MHEKVSELTQRPQNKAKKGVFTVGVHALVKSHNNTPSNVCTLLLTKIAQDQALKISMRKKQNKTVINPPKSTNSQKISTTPAKNRHPKKAQK